MVSWCRSILFSHCSYISNSRWGIQLSGHFFRFWEVMGTNFQKECGRIVCGTISSRCWMALLTRWGKWFNRSILGVSCEKWIFFLVGCNIIKGRMARKRNRHSGRESSAYAYTSQVTKRIFCAWKSFAFVHFALIVINTWITYLFSKSYHYSYLLTLPSAFWFAVAIQHKSSGMKHSCLSLEE